MVPAAQAAALERLANEGTSETPARRMLVIVNPYATTMSVRLKHLVVYALQGRFEVEAVDTQRKGHAIELFREAASEGYDVVVAFGGDGPVDVGRVNDRWFTFAAGAGLDATVVERVDRHPRLKARFGPYYYAQAAIATFLEKYVVDPPHVIATADGRETRGVSVFVQNTQPYTYF